MIEAGDSAEHARAMYDESVTTVVVAAVVVAVARQHRPGDRPRPDARPAARARSARAARRIADGDYAARVPREGPEEIASLADSFNQMAASLEEQERMRRDFIANAAHELRTPLTNLQGYLEALRDGVIVADRATYESLCEEADRLVRLSRSLDALAEGDAASEPAAARGRSTWSAAVRAAVELAQPAIERAGLRLVRRRARRLPARANPDHLAQVLANLLSNAVRYTPPRRHGHGPGRAPSGRPAGLGREHRRRIPPEDLDRVFERFYRVEKSRDRARGGAGIGLAIVKQLVEAGGGPGRGGVGRRPDPLLVQPPGLIGGLGRPPSRQRDRRQARGDAGQAEPLVRPQPLAPDEHDATRTVTTGPNELARPTIHVGACSSPIANATKPTMSSRPPTIATATRPQSAGAVGRPGQQRRGGAGGRRPRARTTQTVAAFAVREPSRTGSQPALRIGPARPIVRIAKQTRATIAKTHAPARRSGRRAQPPSETSPVRITPTVATAAPSAWSGVSVSPRRTTASTTVSPPYAATTGLTTDTGPIRSAVKNDR